MEQEIYSLRLLLADVIKALDYQNNYIKEVIEERLFDIESTVSNDFNDS